MRLRAVRALMLRDVDAAVDAYSQLTRRRPSDPGAWLDLGRAQDAAALTADAKSSYETAIRIDGQYAPARLRLASLLGLEGRRDEALKSFDEAERIYRAGSNVEGEVESLIRRGGLLNGMGEFADARTALQRARDLAGNVQSQAQQIRAELQLSSVIASEGRWSDAEKLAASAVDRALADRFEIVAADGLSNLAEILVRQGRAREADAHLVEAIELAGKRRVQRLVNRAMLQASLILQNGDPAGAIAAAAKPLGMLRANATGATS